MIRKILCLLLIFWAGGGLVFYYYLCKGCPDNNSKTDAIVVLTGSSGRIELGCELMRQSLADKLFISGVDHKVSLDNLTDKPLDDIPIYLGYQSYDTISNAKEVFKWSKQENIQSLRLVTTNAHMPRALIIFKHAMPEVVIIPHPLQLNPIPFLWVIREYHKFILTMLGFSAYFSKIKLT